MMLIRSVLLCCVLFGCSLTSDMMFSELIESLSPTICLRKGERLAPRCSLSLFNAGRTQIVSSAVVSGRSRRESNSSTPTKSPSLLFSSSRIFPSFFCNSLLIGIVLDLKMINWLEERSDFLLSSQRK